MAYTELTTLCGPFYFMTNAFSFESIQAEDKVKSLTPSIYIESNTPADKAFISCEGEVRWRYDGGDPTSTVGHLMRDGSCLILHGKIQIETFRFINSGNQPAILSISYER